MAFFQQKILVLDRGSKFYKGMLIEQGFGNFEILKMEKLPVIKELIFTESESEELDKEYFISEYNFLRFAKTLFTDEKEIIFLLKNEEAYIRNLEIPAEKEELALSLLENELENYLPVSLEEVQVIGKVWEIKDSTAKIIGFASQNKILESFSKLMIESGFSLKMLTVESVALASAIELLPEDEFLKKNICQMDVGYSKTIVNFIHKGKLIFTRTIPFGIENLENVLKFYLKQTKWNPKDIENFIFEELFKFYNNFKKETQSIPFNLKKEEQKELFLDLENELNFFINELNRTLFTFNLEYFSYFLLSGGGALISGLSDFIEEKLNIQSKRYDIQLGNEPIEPWIICLGGYLHYKKPPKEKLDFLKTNLGKTLKKGEIRFKAFVVPSFLMGISFIVLLISIVIGFVSERKQLEFYRGKIQEVALQTPEISKSSNPVQKAKQICEEKINYWKNIIAGTKILDILREIEEHTPSPDVAKVQFKSLRYFENQVNLEIVVDSISQIVKVQEELQKSRMFSSVEVVRRDILAGQKVRLEISINIKPKDIKLNMDCK
ncbi:MAG: pilus assembly protein PilM [Leptonema sp. (in: bacteria)]